MAYIHKGKAYPDSTEIVEAHGRTYLAHIAGVIEVTSGDSVTREADEDLPPWAAGLPVVPAEDGARLVAENALAARSEAAAKLPTDRQIRVASLMSLANAAGTETKGWHAEHEKRAGLGIPNNLKAAEYKPKCKADARAQLERLGL